MTSRLGDRQKLKEGMSLGNLSIVGFHAAKVPTNVFPSTLIFHLTRDYIHKAILSCEGCVTACEGCAHVKPV